MNTTKISIIEQDPQSAPLHVQIARMCHTDGLGLSRKTMRLLENAAHIEILVDNDSYRWITIDEAVEAINRGCDVRQRDCIYWDWSGECWTLSGDYFLELTPKR